MENLPEYEERGDGDERVKDLLDQGIVRNFDYLRKMVKRWEIGLTVTSARSLTSSPCSKPIP